MGVHSILVGSQLALRAAAGGTVSYYAAAYLGLQHPIYALVAAIIVTDFAPGETKRLSLQRLIATGIGAMCGVALSMAFGHAQWLAGIGIFIAMVLSHACNASAGAKVAGYVCALIILSSGDDPLIHALHRVIETVLGIAVAWVLSLVPRLVEFKAPASPEKGS
jgi:uncharacterized membrane protein YgaE (UPF0421/DUF939 family)